MLYAKVDKNGTVLESGLRRVDIRKRFTHKLLAEVDFDDNLPEGYELVTPARSPDIDREEQEAGPGDYVRGEDGKLYTSWVVRDRSPEAKAQELASAKAELWGRVKEIREAKKEAGVTVPGVGTFDTDQKSRENIDGAVLMASIASAAGQPYEIDFTLKDNGVATLDAQAMIGAGVFIGGYVGSLHTYSRTLRAAIDAATTKAELEAIDIEEGWP